jgi:hypothetical protein
VHAPVPGPGERARRPLGGDGEDGVRPAHLLEAPRLTKRWIAVWMRRYGARVRLARAGTLIVVLAAPAVATVRDPSAAGRYTVDAAAQGTDVTLDTRPR